MKKIITIVFVTFIFFSSVGAVKLKEYVTKEEVYKFFEEEDTKLREASALVASKSELSNLYKMIDSNKRIRELRKNSSTSNGED